MHAALRARRFSETVALPLPFSRDADREFLTVPDLKKSLVYVPSLSIVDLLV
jgi:hypothetical protein